MGAAQKYLSQRDRIEAFERHMRDNDEARKEIAKALKAMDARLRAIEQALLECQSTDVAQQRELDDRLNGQVHHALILAHVYVLATDWRPWRRWRSIKELRRLFAAKGRKR